MGQRITVKIAGEDFTMTADTPERERYMRLAADYVNKTLSDYARKYPDRSTESKLSMIAFNQAFTIMSLQAKAAGTENGLKELSDQIDDYLNNLNR